MPVIIAGLMSRFSSLAFLALAIAACGDNILLHDASIAPPPPSEPPDARTSVVVPNVYGFESQFQNDRNSVFYDEPPHLHVLARELDLYLAGLTAAIDDSALAPADGDVLAVLERYYDFDLATDGRTDLALTTDPPTFQPSLDSMARGNDIGLRDFIAGNAPAGQHQDWTQAFTGWQEGDATSPDALVRYWLARIDDLAVARAGAVPTGPDGEPIPAVYITPQGQDLRQLVASFLIGAVDFSQAVDVHLDDDTAGLGVSALNSRKGELLYSEAEHQWDLAFGYYGAAYDALAYNDDEIAAVGGRDGWSAGYHDSTASGAIDLRYEYNHASARLASALDIDDPTPDRSRALFVAFLTGRAILQGSGEPMSAERRAALIEQRDIIVRTWEQILAETAVGALDQTLASMETFGTDAYDFAAHARAWSTLEGTVLGLQFSRFSPLSAEDRAAVYQHLGDAPVLPDAGADAIAAYRTALTAARALLVAAYGLGS